LPIAFRSAAASVPFEACTVSSRVRWMMLEISESAPSAVWTSETPSLALRTAWFVPVTFERSFSAIARPAASSAARVIR